MVEPKTKTSICEQKMNVVELRKSNISNNVCCMSNDSIVCYCDNEKEANDFIKGYNAFVERFQKR